LRMLASCELSLRSLSNALNIETPVRNMSIGWVFFGKSCSICSTSFGNGRCAAICSLNSFNCLRFGSSPLSSRYATSSNVALFPVSWMSEPRYISPALGSTQQIAVSPAITPASPGLYSGFAPVLIELLHVNNDTPFDKYSVAKTFPFFSGGIVIEQIVKLFPCLHLIEPIGLRAGVFQCREEFLTRFH